MVMEAGAIKPASSEGDLGWGERWEDPELTLPLHSY
jgi:hypothetical protein